MSKVNKQVKGNNGKPVKQVVEESDSEESDVPVIQTKKAPVAQKQPVKTQLAKKVQQAADSDEESDTPVVKPTTAQKGKAVVQQKKPVQQDSDDESDDEPVVQTKKTVPAKKPVVQQKKPVQQDSDEESDDEPVVQTKKTVPAKKASVDNTKKPVVQQKKPVQQDSDDESDDEPVVQTKKAVPAKKASVDNTKKPVVQQKKPVQQDSDEDSDDEPVVQTKKTVPAKKASIDNTKKPVAQQKKVVQQDSDDESDDEPVKKPAAQQQQQQQQTKPAQQQAQQSTQQSSGTKQLYEVIVKGLSFDADEQIIGEFFTTYGEVDSVNILKNFDGRSKGIAFVRFETEEGQQKAAAEANGITHMNRQIWVEAAQARGQRPARDNASHQGQGQVTEESTTIFVGNLSFKSDEHSLANYFSQCGTVVSTRIAKGEDGRSRGFGHVEFAGKEEVEKALKLAGSDLDGRPVKVDVAAPRQGGGRGGDNQRGAAGGFGGPRRGGPIGRGRGGVFLSDNDKAAKKGVIVPFAGTRTKL